MSDRMRITGMNSGMDTESIVQQLVAARQIKVDNLKNDQKKLEWKQTAWQDLNSKIYNLYSNTLSKLRLTGAYKKKTTTVSDASKASVTADGNAADGTHTLSIQQLAKAGYLTGKKLSKEAKSYTSDSLMKDIDSSLVGKKITLTDNQDSSKSTTITIGENTKISDFVKALEGSNRYNVFFNDENKYIDMTESSLNIAYDESDPVLSKLGIFNLGENGCIVDPNISFPDDAKPYTSTSLLSDIDPAMVGKQIKLIDSKDSNFSKTITITKDMTLSQLADEAKATRYVASFDEAKQRFEIRDPNSSFTISDEEDGSVLSKLGIDSNDKDGWIQGSVISVGVSYTSESTLSKFGIDNDAYKITVRAGKGKDLKETEIALNKDMKVSELISKLRDAGINASFDESNQRFFLSSKEAGADNDFTIEGNIGGYALIALGLDTDAGAKKINAADAKITLNGMEYTSTRNTFNINGLAINAMGVTDGDITITTSTDYKGAYDTIKEFLSEYNDVINEIDKLYNADSARKYKMLSSDEKDTMSDEEVEKWEGTIKGSLLRKDTQLRTVMDAMTRSMNEFGSYVNGKRMHLSDYGIKTLGYFKAKDFEHYAYHIDGDQDDDNVSGEKDYLMKALTTDPDGTIQFFADLSKNVYDKIGEIMNKTSEYSSIYKVYNDKQLKKDYDNYTKKIKEAEDKLSAYEDKWYDKFAKMEKALAKLQSSQSTVSSMLGK